MPWTIYRYILRDLLWILTLATTVLVVVIGVAIAIKPLQDGMLGPLGLLKFVLYTIPTVVGFALPFAGAFATTLVFARMATDNEITACRASGLGFHVVLLPVLTLGLVLAPSMYYLSNWVVPEFFKKTERLLERDLIRLLVSNVKQGHPFKIDDLLIYADAVHEVSLAHQADPVPGVDSQRLLVLQGVAVAQLDRAGRVRSDTTAQRADVLVYHAGGDAWVKIHLTHAMHYDTSSSGNWTYSESIHFQDIRLPSLTRNKPKFLSLPELRELNRHPERYDQVMQRKQQLVNRMAAEQIARALMSNAASAPAAEGDGATTAWAGRGVTLLGGSAGEHYVIRPGSVASRVGQGVQLTAHGGRPVRVDYYVGGMVAHHYEAREAMIRIDSSHDEPAIRVELLEATVLDARLSDRRTQRSALRLPWMRWPQPVRAPLAQLPREQLLELAQQSYADVEPVQAELSALMTRIGRLGYHITAQLNQRAASALGCALVLLLGALLSLRMQGRLPLVVYFWAFLLAVVSVVIVRSGENLITDVRTPLWIGVTTTWAGNLIVLAVCAALGWRLMRT
jgi:lipopolysaccharide export system permease protein